MNFAEVINQLAVMMLIIALGFAAKKLKILNEDGDKTLASLVVNITSPLLIIFSKSSMPSGEVFGNVLAIAIMTVCSMLFSYFLASRAVLFVKSYSNEEKTIYRFSTVFGNASFIGFPLCYALFGNTGLLYASIYSAIQDVFFWTLGVKIMTGGNFDGKLTKLLNPNIFAIVIGVVILVTGIQLPVFAQNTLSTVGNTTVPLALLVAGSGFQGFMIKSGSLKHFLLPTFLKLAAVPLLAVIILTGLPIIDAVPKYVFLLEISMPCAASIVVFARNYGRDHKLASEIFMFMTIASMVTIPLIVLLIKSL
ncbi:MAG TPA: AEC family transporter [Clostridiaceae bacterium]|nr:AEC family transporter [Clostridiaceae bacterium]